MFSQLKGLFQVRNCSSISRKITKQFKWSINFEIYVIKMNKVKHIKNTNDSTVFQNNI